MALMHSCFNIIFNVMLCFTYEMMLVIANARLVSVEIKLSSNSVSKPCFSENPDLPPFLYFKIYQEFGVGPKSNIVGRDESFNVDVQSFSSFQKEFQMNLKIPFSGNCSPLNFKLYFKNCA